MRPLESLFAGMPWLGVALFQATAMAGVGYLIWLASRRWGPAARAAVLFATLLGVLAVPVIGSVSPVWLPLPEPELPVISVLDWPGPPAYQPVAEEEMTLQPEPAAAAEAVAELAPANQQPAAAPGPVSGAASLAASAPPPAGQRWSVASVLTVIWLAGAAFCLLRAGLGLAALYSCRRRATPLCDAAWQDRLQTLARQHGLRPDIELRESAQIGSPLTLGLVRPVILVPAGWRLWSAEQRTMILSHELAHVRRRDFLTALFAELTACLYWFHPLVRWLAGRLRLEQEYAADASVASAEPDPRQYLCCLARLALEMDQDTGSLAPAFWRRRPEIIRRINMLRENTSRQAVRLGTWSRCAAAPLAVAAYAVVAGLGYLQSADPGQPVRADAPKAGEVQVRTDLHGDALPSGALQRLGTVRFRHQSTAIAYSPDGKVLASGGRDNVVRLFDAATGKELRRLIGHKPRIYAPAADAKNPIDTLVTATGEGGVNSVVFSPDGKVLASGGWDDTIRLWDVATGKELRKIDAHKAMVGRVVFSPDGKVLASRGALDGTVKLWDPTTGTLLHKIVGLNNINPWRFNHDMALAISPDSKTLVTTARNTMQDPDPAKKVAKPGYLLFYDIASGQELKRLESNSYGITVAYSPDGKMLATGGVDPGVDVYSLRIWDVASGKELRQCTLPKNEPPTYLSWDPNNNGKFAAVIAEDNMHIFDANTGKEVIPIKHYWPSRVIYSKDGKTLASAGSGPTIRHWDAATGQELHLEFAGHQSGVAAVATTADGKLVASGGENIRLWDPATGKVVRTIETKGGVACLAFAPDGKTLASGGRDRIVHLWDVGTGQPVQDLKGHKNALCGLAFSRDGKLLASGDVQSTVRIWDVKEAKQLQEIDNKSGTENLSLAFAPDNTSLVCAGAWNDSSFLPKQGQVLKINGKEVKFDGVINIQGVEMSRKEGYYVLQWDVSTGKEVRKLAGLTDKIRSLAYSPDSKLVAAASKDGKICVWDAETGADRLHFLAHPGHADAAFSASPCLAFAPDSKTLASASTDRTIRLWDVATARETGQFRAPDSPFHSITFSKDGKTLISGSGDTGVLIWDVSAAGNPPAKDKSNVITIQ